MCSVLARLARAACSTGDPRKQSHAEDQQQHERSERVLLQNIDLMRVKRLKSRNVIA